MKAPIAINAREAPPGYYAVLKSEIRRQNPEGNLCRHCDWRPCCDGEYMCMDYTIITREGKERRRADGCSVLFKKLNPE